MWKINVLIGVLKDAIEEMIIEVDEEVDEVLEEDLMDKDVRQFEVHFDSNHPQTYSQY